MFWSAQSWLSVCCARLQVGAARLAVGCGQTVDCTLRLETTVAQTGAGTGANNFTAQKAHRKHSWWAWRDRNIHLVVGMLPGRKQGSQVVGLQLASVTSEKQILKAGEIELVLLFIYQIINYRPPSGCSCPAAWGTVLFPCYPLLGCV